jgi:LPS export ABC transporter protein LptC
MKHFVVICSLSLAACSGSQAADPIASDEAQSQRADQVMYGVKQYISSEGIRRGLLNADTAFVFEDSGRVDIRKVQLQLFNESGSQAASLTSRAGSLDTRSQGMIARGGVVLKTQDGKRIETEELHYDPNSHRVWSTVTTRMIENNGSPLTGDGFSADDHMRNIQITRPRGRIGGAGRGLKF